MKRQRLNYLQLHELLIYEPLTGRFWWKHRGREWFETLNAYAVWNSAHAGKPAFSNVDEGGYHRGKILNWEYKAHQVAWCMCFGSYPDLLDHENGVRTDNRIANLRHATHAMNSRNMARFKNNNSGVTGVNFHKNMQMWWARIVHKGERIDLGLFVSFDEAVSARRIAEQVYGYHRNHGKR